MPRSITSPRTSRGRAGVNATLVVVLAAAAALIVLRRDEAPVGATVDDAVYVEMARSLAEGRGPVLAVGPDTPPANPGIFPPGFPLLLAPLALAFPASLAALKLVPLLAAAWLAWLCARLPTVPGSARVGPALVALVMLNPWVVGWSARVLSDLPFTALSLAVLTGAEGWLAVARPGAARSARIALPAGLAVLVRSVGWALVLALAVHLALGRRWRHLLHLAAGVAVTQAVLMLPGWSGGGPLTAAYREQLLGHSPDPAARAAFVAANAWGYMRELPVVLCPWFGAPVARRAAELGAGGLYAAAQAAVGLALLALAVAGWLAMRESGQDGARGRARLWLLYLALQAAALADFAGWPSGVQPRLLLPALPLLYVLVLGGVARLSGRGNPAAMRRGLALALALMLTGSLAHNAWRIARPLRAVNPVPGRSWADPGLGADWLRVHAGPADLVIASDPLPRHIHLRRPVAGPGDTLTAAALARRASRLGARWVLAAPPVAAAGPAAASLRDTLAAAGVWGRPAWADPAGCAWVFAVPPRSGVPGGRP